MRLGESIHRWGENFAGRRETTSTYRRQLVVVPVRSTAAAAAAADTVRRSCMVMWQQRCAQSADDRATPQTSHILPAYLAKQPPTIMNNHLRRTAQFYPGLAAFTDAIEALPQETIRHFTLLREVDAKASGPEDLLRTSIKHALGLPPPVNSVEHGASVQTIDDAHSARDGASLNSDTYPPDPHEEEAYEHSRRSRLHQVRLLISDLLLTLDEKIHVISTASEALTKHLVRVDDAYEVVTHEIDPTIRDGNPIHWAYGISVPEGLLAPRQGVNEHAPSQTAQVNTYGTEPESGPGAATTSRTESRREAVSRRQLQVPDTLDSKGLNHHGTSNIVESSLIAHENPLNLPAAKRRKGVAHTGPPIKTLAPERTLNLVRSGGQSNLANTPATTAKGHGSHVAAPNSNNLKLSGARKR
ncbi:hypothetical protein ABW20_dc0102692 [Dactylellina cionopaga]|nr:hypothetical protein ABW20_dc0102692 [Dactylellina cionopaga]